MPDESPAPKQRAIWRPNAIPPDVWEAMSREDQIQWWKNRRGPAQPKPHMKGVIQDYERGHETLQGFCVSVSWFAAADEIDEFVRECPSELMEALKEFLADYGPDESNWPRSYAIRCYDPWVTAEEIQESERREQERIWNGVRLLKQHLP